MTTNNTNGKLLNPNAIEYLQTPSNPHSTSTKSLNSQLSAETASFSPFQQQQQQTTSYDLNLNPNVNPNRFEISPPLHNDNIVVMNSIQPQFVQQPQTTQLSSLQPPHTNFINNNHNNFMNNIDHSLISLQQQHSPPISVDLMGETNKAIHTRC